MSNSVQQARLQFQPRAAAAQQLRACHRVHDHAWIRTSLVDIDQRQRQRILERGGIEVLRQLEGNAAVEAAADRRVEALARVLVVDAELDLPALIVVGVELLAVLGQVADEQAAGERRRQQHPRPRHAEVSAHLPVQRHVDARLNPFGQAFVDRYREGHRRVEELVDVGEVPAVLAVVRHVDLGARAERLLHADLEGVLPLGPDVDARHAVGRQRPRLLGA